MATVRGVGAGLASGKRSGPQRSDQASDLVCIQHERGAPVFPAPTAPNHCSLTSIVTSYPVIAVKSQGARNKFRRPQLQVHGSCPPSLGAMPAPRLWGVATAGLCKRCDRQVTATWCDPEYGLGCARTIATLSTCKLMRVIRLCRVRAGQRVPVQ